MNTQEISNSESGVFGLKLTVMTLDVDPSSKPVTQVFYKDELTLGRLPSNDVVLGRPEISGIHARLRIEKGRNGDPDRLFITDLGSSNGTSVEKSQLRPRVEIAMMPNERIFIGNYVIKPTIISPNSASQTAEHDTSSQHDSSAHSGGHAFAENSSPTTTMKRNLLSDAVKEYEGSFSNQIKDSSPTSSFIFKDDSEASKTSDKSEYNFTMSDMDSKPTQNFSRVSLDEGFGDRNKTMEFKPPFGGTPFSQEEEVLRSAKEIEKAVESNIEELVSPVVEEVEEEVSLETFKEVSEEPLNVKPEVESKNGNGFHHSAPAWISRESDEIKSEEVKPKEEPSFSQTSPYASKEDTLSIKVKIDGADVRSMNFVARAYTELKGAVKHKGSPLSGVLVDGGALGTTITQSDGTFSFSRVLEGTDYKLAFSKDKFSLEPAELSGKVSPDSQLTSVTATELFSISGIITYQGVPLAGVEVNGGELGTTYTREDGSYLFENVPEGKEYSLSLHKEGYVFKS